MDYARYCLMLLSMVVLLLVPRMAGAKTCIIEGDAVVDSRSGSCEIVVKHRHLTAVHVSSPVQKAKIAGGWSGIRLEAEATTVFVNPLDAKVGFTGTMQVKTKEYDVAVRIRVSGDSQEVDDVVSIVHADPLERIKAELKAEYEAQAQGEVERRVSLGMREVEKQAQHRKEALDAEHERRSRELDQKAGRRKMEFLRSIMRHRRGQMDVRVRGRTQARDGGVNVLIEDGMVSDDELVVFFSIDNRGQATHEMTDLQVYGENTRNHVAATYYVEAPANGHIKTIAAGQRAKGAMLLPLAQSLGEPLTIMIRAPGAALPVITTMDVIRLVPEEPPDENEGMKTLSLLGIYGATWIDDAMPDTEELEATSIKGLGMRVSYGLTKRWNVEVDAVLASTGEAEFGDMARSATMGRVSAGGLLRLGSGRYVPVLRGGIGLQGANYSGLGEGFEFDLTWSVGGGLDVKAGPFVLGLALGGGALMQHRGNWFEGGLHLGYAWKQ